jgi:cell wall-associated NlpC family hydrolase
VRNLIRNITLILIITMIGAVVAISVDGTRDRAGATPIDDKRAQAAAIQDQIDANGEEIGALAEQFNGAQLRLDEANQQITDAQAHIDAAKAEVARIKGLVRDRAASVYRRALAGQSLSELDLSDTKHLVSRKHYAEAQASRDDQLLDQLRLAQQDLARDRAAGETARAQAETDQAAIDTAKTQLEAANAKQQEILQQVNGELEQLVQQEAQRRAEEAARAARSRYAPGALGDGNPEAFPNLPASGAAAAAIDFARAQLGKPYVYAATGPDSYDCSGLTMSAYAAAGVRMPHYSGAQYSSIPHVPLDAMQPGDLVFWGAGGGSHVGIYVGNGLMIHAPHTGDVVKIAAVYGHPVGAGRPGV